MAGLQRAGMAQRSPDGTAGDVGLPSVLRRAGVLHGSRTSQPYVGDVVATAVGRPRLGTQLRRYEQGAEARLGRTIRSRLPGIGRLPVQGKAMTAPARRSTPKPNTSTSSLSTDLDGLEDLLDGLVSFVDSVVLPLEAAHADIFRDDRAMYDPSGAMAPLVRDLHRQTRMAAARAGFYGMCVPTALGGGGQGPLLHYLAWERLYHRYGPGSHLPYSSIAHWARGPSHLFAAASPALQERVLPQLMSGEVSLCFCLSEPDAGSDSWNLRTMAEPTGNGWRLNGTKQWATNGPSADYALVFAVTDTALARQRRGGVTAFVVATDAPGFRVGSGVRVL